MMTHGPSKELRFEELELLEHLLDKQKLLVIVTGTKIVLTPFVCGYILM